MKDDLTKISHRDFEEKYLGGDTRDGKSALDRIAELEKENETLRRHLDVTEHGLYIPPTKSDEILRAAAIYQRNEELVQELESHRDMLRSALIMLQCEPQKFSNSIKAIQEFLD